MHRPKPTTTTASQPCASQEAYIHTCSCIPHSPLHLWGCACLNGTPVPCCQAATAPSLTTPSPVQHLTRPGQANKVAGAQTWDQPCSQQCQCQQHWGTACLEPPTASLGSAPASAAQHPGASNPLTICLAPVGHQRTCLLRAACKGWLAPAADVEARGQAVVHTGGSSIVLQWFRLALRGFLAV